MTTKMGNRYLVVVTQGWVFAGDLEIVEDNGTRLRLHRGVGVDSWEGIGLDGLTARTPRKSEATLRVFNDTVDIPAGCELFRVPVEDSWGLSQDE